MWIVGDGEEDVRDCIGRSIRKETRPPGTDVVRQAMQQRAYEPPALGLGTARGEAPRDGGARNITDLRS